MANAATTHVIEIETGIGEPAFIPLSMGQELQPISVGKKGMWRIESPRVLDVHAFVYFDGNSLFLQSADEQAAASVDGYRVGKAWTELHAPCKIEIGTARLRYRSLIADADNQPTMGMPNAPVAPPPGGPGMGQAPANGLGPAATGAPPPPAPPSNASTSQPLSFPKADRPFKPGEFAAKADDESTRIAPLEATGANRAVTGAMSSPRPAAGAPVDPRAATVGVVSGSGQFGALGPGQMPPSAMMGPGPMMGGPPSMGPGSMGAPGAMGPMSGPMSGMAPNGAPGMYPPQPGFGPGYPQSPQQQSYGSLPGSGQPGISQGIPPQSLPPGGYGSMTPQGGMQQPMQPGPGGGNDLVAKLKATQLPMKAIAIALITIAVALFLLDDDEPEPVKKKKPVATLDGGAADGGKVAAAGTSGTAPNVVPPVLPIQPITSASTPVANNWPPGVPCPPPNWPPNTPLPCTPNNVGSTPDKPDKPDKPSGKDPKDSKDAGLAPGTKTLERQAVDYVASGETAKAAAAYEELVRRDPKNPVYAEAARILRAKLDAGAP